jgi:hypothetical protein
MIYFFKFWGKDGERKKLSGRIADNVSILRVLHSIALVLIF